jgi:heat shock protein HslJ
MKENPKSTLSRVRTLVSTLLLPALALASIALSGPGPAHAQASGLPPGMVGTEWKLIEIRQSGQEVKGTADAGITLLFEMEGRIGGASPCNSYSATYQVGAGETLTFGQVVSTLRACVDPSLQALESEYYTALSGVSSYSFQAGRLSLFFNNGQGVLEFVAPATPGMPRAGSSGEHTSAQVMRLLLAVLLVSLIVMGLRRTRARTI